MDCRSQPCLKTTNIHQRFHFYNRQDPLKDHFGVKQRRLFTLIHTWTQLNRYRRGTMRHGGCKRRPLKIRQYWKLRKAYSSSIKLNALAHLLGWQLRNEVEDRLWRQYPISHPRWIIHFYLLDFCAVLRSLYHFIMPVSRSFVSNESTPCPSYRQAAFVLLLLPLVLNAFELP